MVRCRRNSRLTAERLGLPRYNGVRTRITDPDYRQRAVTLLRAYGYRTEPGDIAVKPERLIELMTSDKKKKGGRVRFILQRNLCETILQPLDPELLREVLA